MEPLKIDVISSDVGIEVAKELKKDFETFKIDKKLDDHKEILKLLADKLAIDLQKYEKDLSMMGNAKSAGNCNKYPPATVIKVPTNQY